MPALRQGFSPDVRLKRPAQFRLVFAHGVRLGDAYFTLVAMGNAFAHARLGLVISRKCARRAVVRNRIKRVVRESFRLNLTGLPATDIVVMCRPVVQHASNDTLFAALIHLWRRLNQRCPCT